MPAPIIQTKDLTKMFGDLKAVDKVSFHVDQGEIYGLLGPNGAGKSTIIRMLTTLTRPTAGSATIAGHDILRDEEQVRELVGLVSEKMIMYDRLTAYENMRFFAKIYNVPKRDIDQRITELLESVNMSKWADSQIGTFSTGMRQRINVVRALVSMPKVMFMDEPTLGLDPQSTSEIRALIRKLRDEQGMSIVLTTHIMNEADMLCDRIGLIDKGIIVAEGTPSELKGNISEKGATIVDLDLIEPPHDANDRLRTLEGVTSASQKENRVKVIVQKEDAFQEIMEGTIRLGLNVRNAVVAQPSLEDVFLHYTGRSMTEAQMAAQTTKKVKHGRRHGPHGARTRSRIR